MPQTRQNVNNCDLYIPVDKFIRVSVLLLVLYKQVLSELPVHTISVWVLMWAWEERWGTLGMCIVALPHIISIHKRLCKHTHMYRYNMLTQSNSLATSVCTRPNSFHSYVTYILAIG